eukprot:40067-Chlamydomonas_euryale.AAC.2
MCASAGEAWHFPALVEPRLHASPLPTPPFHPAPKGEDACAHSAMGGMPSAPAIRKPSGHLESGLAPAGQMCAELGPELHVTALPRLSLPPSLPPAVSQVRWAACQALGQMCTDLGPELQTAHHAKLLPALMALMDDFNNPRVQVWTCGV